MSDDQLAQVQRDIDEQLEAVHVDWLRLATAPFDPEERNRIRDEITSNENYLMDLLERKWALQRN
jgi:hypothetical protein